MTLQRIHELMIELDNERLSWAEIAEIDGAAVTAGLTDIEDMMAVDILLALEEIEANKLNCNHANTAETLDSLVCEDCGLELELQDDGSEVIQ